MKHISHMHLIELFVPLYDSEGNQFPEIIFSALKDELTETFGGLTIHSHAPATGLWKADDEKTVRDTIIIYEVMTEEFDEDYWKGHKIKLQQDLQQDEIMIRATQVRLV